MTLYILKLETSIISIQNSINNLKNNNGVFLGINNILGNNQNIGLNMPNFDIKSESIKDPNLKGNSNSNIQFNSRSNISINKTEEDKNKNYKQNENESEVDKDSFYIKYPIEYGSTKGYKRPKIKKGKDFVHKPEFRMKGTVQTTKKIPPTLKSIFEGKVKDSIKLNNDSLKNPLFKIKDEDIQIITTINLNNNLKENNNLINIKRESSNRLQGLNIRKHNDNIKYIVEYRRTKGYKRPRIIKGKDFVHEPAFRIKGNIKRNKIIKSSYKNNNNTAQLTSSKTLYFIEYGATLNYKRPKIKKGKDFYHEPKDKFFKNDSD